MLRSLVGSEMCIRDRDYTTQIIILALLVSVTSITLWAFLGKFLRKFATNDKFINYFNSVSYTHLTLPTNREV